MKTPTMFINIVATLAISILSLQNSIAATNTPSSPCLIITERLGLESSGSQVVALQKFLGFEPFALLGDSGYGYFGANTEGLLKNFQSENGLPQTGVVDTATAEKIKQLSCSPSPKTTTTSASKPTATQATTQAFAVTASYRGKVIDEQKVPLAGVVVELQTSRAGFDALYNNKHRVITATDGTYTFTGAQSSQVYQTLSFKKDGYILDKMTLTHGTDLKQSDFVLKKTGSSAVTYHWESSPIGGILPSPRPPICNPVPVVGTACTAESSGCISGEYGYRCVMDTQAKSAAVSGTGTSVVDTTATQGNVITSFVVDTIDRVLNWFRR